MSDEHASMEPSSVEDGNPCTARISAAVTLRLQWSRPQLRTETRSPGHGLPRHTPASMEPSSVEDGNRTTAAGPPAFMDRFNGAVLS